MPFVEALLAVTSTAMTALRTGPDALANSWDHIREIADQGGQWLKARPCPDESFGDQLGVLIDQCESLATAFARSAHDPTTLKFDDLADMIRALGTGTVEFLNHLNS
jgi:hypothetical protein